MALHPIDRRSLLTSGASVLLLSAVAGGAAAQAADRKFVFVILRGAMDGLTAVAPYGDPNYAALRGSLALRAPGAKDGLLALSDGFGLHPRLAFLHSQWTEQKLAVLHAAASPYRDRSHFDGQDVLESGGKRVFALDDGWLNRALGASAGRPKDAVAVAKTIPLVLRGSAAVKSWSPSNIATANNDTVTRLMDMYAGDKLLGPALAQAVETSSIVGAGGSGSGGMPKGQAYGGGANVQLAEAAAKLLVAPGGPAAAVFSIDGWDTHANQGAATGQIALRLANLDDVLKALRTGLGVVWEKSVVVVATEFGRTVAINGTNGTDHGQGSAAFVFGGAVKGGRMIGDWPTLARDKLYEGRDLAPVNDLRGLFAAVLAQHWGLDRSVLETRVFPDAIRLPAYPGLIA